MSKRATSEQAATDATTGDNPYVEPGPGGSPRFRPGNPGRPRGSKNKFGKTKRITVTEKRALAETAAEKIQSAVDPHLQEIVSALAEKAKNGDVSAASTLLRHTAVPLTSTPIRGAEDLSGLPPEVRIRMINERLITGRMSVETACVLVDAAKSEIDAAVVQPLRQLLRDFKRTKDIVRFTSELAALPIGALIDGEADRESGSQD